jgi:hypothetical protein
MPNESDQFQQAIAGFDEANAKDPLGKEMLYARRMTDWLKRLLPNASEPLQLAARCQHIRRWEIPRNTFPMDRTGYLRWRKTLYEFHADCAAEIMGNVGYDADTIARVRSLLRKEKIKADPDMQALEDVICLVFLENYFSDFAREKDEEKLLNILRRTWAKMSPQGHEAAMTIQFAPADRALVEKALSKS